MTIPTLCLNMIVKNESKIITRLFDSVLPIIDCYCICDTGSTDETPSIIESYFKEKNIPGKIIYEPFQNFCHNRNVALQSCIGMSDYVLLLDADMRLEIINFDKNNLRHANTFTILQGNQSFYYQNTRIITNNGLYKYVGVTHEYIDILFQDVRENIKKNELFIQDIGDGGSKNDKFNRDIQLLLKGIDDEPDNQRYHFYLANSFHDVGKYDDAIQYYKKRIDMGGWPQEVWYSYYRIGLCYKHKNDYPNAFWYWMEGYDYLPERLEGLYEMLMYYRIHSKHKLAIAIYNICKSILAKKINRDGYLFLHNDVYTYLIDYEYTIIACYNNIQNINNEIVCVMNNGANEYVSNLLNNMKFYKNILQPIKVYDFTNQYTIPVQDKDVTFYSSSSCLIPFNNGANNKYYMNVRYVSYSIDPYGNYNLNCNNIITLNRFYQFSQIDCQKAQIEFYKDEDFIFQNQYYIGVEDIRIFYDNINKQLLYIGTHLNKEDKLNVGYGDYNKGILDKNEATIDLKQNIQNSSCEKNWVFVNFQNTTKIVYQWYPLTICNMVNNEIQVFKQINMPRIFQRIRGSTCGYNYNNEIWFVCHIVSYENPRHYYHMICVFDDQMNLLRYSAPFKFEGEPIEYCLSIVVQTDTIIINYSTWDRTTKMALYDKNYINNIIIYKLN